MIYESYCVKSELFGVDVRYSLNCSYVHRLQFIMGPTTFTNYAKIIMKA